MPFVTDNPRLALEYFIPLAQNLPEADVEVCRADPALVRVNAHRGVDAISPHLAELARRRPDLDLDELVEIKPLSLALLHAADRVPRTVSPREIEEHLKEVRPLRELALEQLEILGALGLVPADRVRAIRVGTGALDLARDAVAISAMFHEFAPVLAGKHPFTAEHLATLEREGSWLVGALQPVNAVRVKEERDPAALLRDRLWTLLSQRYEQLREAAVAIFGLRRLDEYVPPLQSRQAPAASAPSPTPSAAG